MPYYAGIDGGQSSTVAVIGDENGRVLGRGTAGPADEVAQGAESTRLRDALSGALSDAIARAQLPAQTRFEQIVAGVSGYEGKIYGRPPDLPAAVLTLMHDAPIAHAGALAGEAGVIVIAGTGSVAYSQCVRGNTALVGGWGYLFGDEGGAFWLAREALAGAMREESAGDHGAIAQTALEFFNAASLRHLARSFYAGEISRAQLASFAVAVVKAAEDGDARAAQYVKQGAHELVTIAMHAMQRVRLVVPKIAFVGGLTASATMLHEFAQGMREMMPRAQLVEPRYDSAVGALILAYKVGAITPQSITE